MPRRIPTSMNIYTYKIFIISYVCYESDIDFMHALQILLHTFKTN